jgi:hypothetical protein
MKYVLPNKVLKQLHGCIASNSHGLENGDDVIVVAEYNGKYGKHKSIQRHGCTPTHL